MPNSKNDKLIVLVEKMPAFPKSVQQIVQLTSDINASAKDIVRVIECDPVMTVKILKALNSPFYGLPNKTTSVQRAVVHIGLNTIKNIALGVAAMGIIKTNNKAHFNTSDFLLHALATAAISKLLAERLGLSATECGDSFVAGLLHDFGKVVFAEFMPEEFKLALEKSKAQQLPLHQTELEFIGLSHAQAGKLLAEKWELSEPLINAIAYHHEPEHGENVLRDCVFAANQISKHMHFGDGGNPQIDALPDSLVARFGLPLTDLCASLGDLDAVKTEAQSFINE
ncbi:MAG: HDOD domain-containing protein [Methylobacter sp.]|nr:HDOD domain-containing protein [Methylobacter sp.]MDP2097522.1 HDOD domain-containing protein [Methylobacter sp.]MDP2429363.1 HDOD domain-containing protein [Methylobacter sp.]MDP3053788.1 HDOD domain-containing protein [Methylobacter sp.]MDP3362771.1 HDOD domain-containing protein [Methylobacter sp.]